MKRDECLRKLPKKYQKYFLASEQSKHTEYVDLAKYIVSAIVWPDPMIPTLNALHVIALSADKTQTIKRITLRGVQYE